MPTSPKFASSETVICRGSAVKSLGNGKVGGWLVRFGSPNETDLTQLHDYFTKDTDFGPFDRSAILYFHGKNAELGKRTLAVGEIAMKDADGESGIWIEGQLALRDKYERMINEMATKGKLGWSSGTAPHLMEREAQKNGSHWVKKWPLGLDATLTPIPAEPRAEAFAIKSLDDLDLGIDLLSVKALHLGDNAEHHATMSAVHSLSNALHMKLYDTLLDKKAAPEEKSLACMKALSEHHGLCMKCIKSMASTDNLDGDQVGAEMKAILAGALSRVATTRSLTLHAETVATAVKALSDRCLRRLDARARDGRAFPVAALTDLQAASKSLVTLVARAESEAATKSVPAGDALALRSQLITELLQLEASLRA